MKKLLTAALATTLLGSVSAMAAPALVINVDGATDGFGSTVQAILTQGVMEIGWLTQGTTTAQIQNLFAMGDLAGIDLLFNQVVIVPFPSASLDYNSNGGQ